MAANVWLCGPTGAGKSTVAPLLAALRGCDAIDADAFIEGADGRTIARIVAEDGEPAFRAREREAIVQLARHDGTVIALGGGALEDATNQRAVAASGTLVFLDASVSVCERHVARTPGTRPLLREAGALARLHAQRRPVYLQAAVQVAVDGRSAADVAAAVDEGLRFLQPRRDSAPPETAPWDAQR